MFDRPHSKQDPIHREGYGVPQNGGNRPPTVETGVLLIGRGVAYRKTDETDFCWSATVEMGVLLIGRGVAYRKTDETDLCWSAMVETGVLFIGTGVAYRKTGLHGILFISTVDLLQPPRAIVDLLEPPRAPVHPASTARYSTGYCSTTPPPSTVHPALHTTGSCSSRGNATTHCSSKPPATLTVHPIDRLQLAAVAKESLDRVQLTARIDRPLGFTNM